MFFCGIDECSFVITIENLKSEEVNKENFELLFNELKTRLKLESIFGSIEQSEKGSVGYTDVYVIGKNRIRVSYNPNRADMGMYVWISATGLRDLEISENIGMTELYYHLNGMLDNDYVCNWHFTRVDIAFDFIDYGYTVNDLYHKIKADKVYYYARGYDNKQNIVNKTLTSKFSAVDNDGIINTIYIGSRKAKTNFVLRIYNKKDEQENGNKTPYYIDKAKKAEDWVRYEYSFRKDYAKQINQLLDKYTQDGTWLDDNAMLRIVARKALDRLTFVEIPQDIKIEDMDKIDEDDLLTEPMHIIKSFCKSDDDLFKLPARQINDLYNSYKWHKNNESGIINLMYKIKEIYGYQAVLDMFMQFELELFDDDFRPSEDAQKYVDDYFTTNKHNDPHNYAWKVINGQKLELARLRQNAMNDKTTNHND